MNSLSDAALEIISKKGPFWQHQLFSQVVSDEITPWASLRKHGATSKSPAQKTQMAEKDFPGWFARKMGEHAQSVDRSRRICEHLTGLSFGAEGAETDFVFMIDLARELAAGYRDTVTWANGFHGIALPNQYHAVLDAAAEYPKTYLDSVESLPGRILAQLNRPRVIGRRRVDITIDFSPYQEAKLTRESNKLLAEYLRR